jgi:sirohydrochlorin cobaltochelatase
MAPKAPATERRLGRIGLVLGAHGIRGGVGAAAEHAERIAARGLFAEVHACALKGEPGLVETVRAVNTSEIVFAPLLMAEGYTLRAMRRRLDREMPRAAHLTLCRPVGVHPGLGEMIRTKALALCVAKSWHPAETALLVVGHGTERHPDSGTTARWHAAQIAAQGTFAQVTVAFLDELPRVPAALDSLTSARCVAVGLFIDAGEHGEEDIPALLAPAGDRAVYAGPLGPDPLVTGLILDQVHAALGTSIAA